MKKLVKILLWTAGVLTIISFAGGWYLLDYSLTNQYHRDYSLSTELDSMAARNPEIAPWLDSLRSSKQLRDTFINSSIDNVRFHALYVKAPEQSSKVALLLHGYTDDATMMLNIGHIYNTRLNFNIFLPDFRSHGLSEGGDIVQMGWKDAQDLHDWFEVIRNLFGDSTEIVVHGVSMGAATAMMLSANEPAGQTDNIKCYIEDCGYTSVWDEFASEMKNQFGLPPFPLLHAASGLCRLRYGWTFAQASALDALKNGDTKPMLFIHGDADTYVPTSMVYPLYEAKQGDKELWITKGVAHAKSYRDNPEKYARHISDFISKHIDTPIQPDTTSTQKTR